MKRSKESLVLMDTHVPLLMYKIGQALFLYEYSRFGNVWLEHYVESETEAVCYGHTCCFEIIVVLKYYAVRIGSYLPTFQDNRSAPSSRVKHSKKTTAVCCGYTGCFATVRLKYCVENNSSNFFFAKKTFALLMSAQNTNNSERLIRETESL